MAAEEQAMELEALEAIYMDEFKRIDDGSDAPSFELTLVPETGGDDNHVSVCLHVEFPPDYPESSAPRLKVRAARPRLDLPVAAPSLRALRRLRLEPWPTNSSRR